MTDRLRSIRRWTGLALAAGAMLCFLAASPVAAQGTTPSFPAFNPTGMTTASGEAMVGPGAAIDSDHNKRRVYGAQVGRVWQGQVHPRWKTGYNSGMGWPGGITMGQSWSDPTNGEHWGAYFNVTGGMVGCRNWEADLPTSRSDATPTHVSVEAFNLSNVRDGYGIEGTTGDYTAAQAPGSSLPLIGYTDLECGLVMRWLPPQVVVNGTNLISYTSSYGAPGSSESNGAANFGGYRGVIDPTLRSECAIYSGFRMVSGVDVFRTIHQYGTYPDNNYLIRDFVFVNSGNSDEDTDLEHPATLTDFRAGFSGQHYACHVTDGGFNGNRDDEALEYINAWPSYTDGSGNYRQALLFYDLDGSSVPGPDWGDPYGAFSGTNQTTGTNCYARGYTGVAILFAETAPGSGVDDPAEPKGMTWRAENQLRLGSSPVGWDFGKHFRLAYTGEENPTDLSSRRAWPENTQITGGGSLKGHTTVLSTSPGDLPLNATYHMVSGVAIAGLNNRESKNIAFRTLKRDAEGVAPANRQTAAEIALIQSGRDSVLAAMDRMFWNIHGFDPNGNIPAKPAAQNQPYNVPDAPRPPACFWATSGNLQIELQWTDESNGPNNDTGVNDLAGYRIYRAEATPDSDWVLVHDTGSPSVTSWIDNTCYADFTYYYAITAYNDGSSNWVDGKPVESGIFWNWSGWGYYPNVDPGPGAISTATYGATQADSIVVVPNPYNANLAFPSGFIGARDRIFFKNLPAPCTVRIYTAAGALVKTLENTKAATDPTAGSLGWDMSNDYNQLVATGVYIFTVESDAGNYVGKFIIIR